jgi:hypothetical protein
MNRGAAIDDQNQHSSNDNEAQDLLTVHQFCYRKSNLFDQLDDSESAAGYRLLAYAPQEQTISRSSANHRCCNLIG